MALHERQIFKHRPPTADEIERHRNIMATSVSHNDELLKQIRDYHRSEAARTAWTRYWLHSGIKFSPPPKPLTSENVDSDKFVPKNLANFVDTVGDSD